MCGIRCLHALQRHHPRRVRPLRKPCNRSPHCERQCAARICRRHQTLDARSRKEMSIGPSSSAPASIVQPTRARISSPRRYDQESRRPAQPARQPPPSSWRWRGVKGRVRFRLLTFQWRHAQLAQECSRPEPRCLGPPPPTPPQRTASSSASVKSRETMGCRRKCCAPSAATATTWLVSPCVKRNPPALRRGRCGGRGGARILTLAEARADWPQPKLAQAMRVAKRQVALITGLADITGAWPLSRVTGTLSRLAEETLTIGVRHLILAAHHRRHPASAGAGNRPRQRLGS